MKRIFISLLAVIGLFPFPLKAQIATDTIECMPPSYSELYTLLDADLVFYGYGIINHGPFTSFKIEELLKHDAYGYKLGDTINVFLDDAHLQKLSLENVNQQKARLSLKLGSEHWELKYGSNYSYKPLGQNNSLEIREQRLLLPANSKESASLLREFLNSYEADFSEGLPAKLTISAKDLARLKKTNPIIRAFEKYDRSFLTESAILEPEERVEDKPSASQNNLPKYLAKPILQNAGLDWQDLLLITDFFPKDSSFDHANLRVYIKLFINEEGLVYKTELLKGVHKEFDNYALERAKNSGPWQALVENGKTHKAFFILPFNFVIGNDH